MRIRHVIISGTILLLVLSGMIIFYYTKKPDINEVIEQSIEPLEEVVTKEETNENNQPENDLQESPPEQIKDIIVDTVINAVDFFLQNEVTIVGIGDSLTKGVGDSTKKGGYIGILDQMINHEKQVVSFENYGKSGLRTDQLINRLDEQEISSALKKSKIILITIGANDIMQVAKENFTNLTYDLFATEKIQYKHRLYEIFNKINDINPNSHVYLLGIYNPFARYFEDIVELDNIVDDWNQTSEAITKEFQKTTFIPIKDLFEDSDINLFSDDHFHPNKIGYHRMAERVLEYLITKEEGSDDNG